MRLKETARSPGHLVYPQPLDYTASFQFLLPSLSNSCIYLVSGGLSVTGGASGKELACLQET